MFNYAGHGYRTPTSRSTTFISQATCIIHKVQGGWGTKRGLANKSMQLSACEKGATVVRMRCYPGIVARKKHACLCDYVVKCVCLTHMHESWVLCISKKKAAASEEDTDAIRIWFCKLNHIWWEGTHWEKSIFFTRKVPEHPLTIVVFVALLHATLVFVHAFLKVRFHLCIPMPAEGGLYKKLVDLKPMSLIVPYSRQSQAKEKLFPLCVALDMSRMWIWCLNANTVVSGDFCIHRRSFQRKKEKNWTEWIHWPPTYLWCYFEVQLLGKLVRICDRHFLWRPSWMPVLYSIVPTHLWLYVKRWKRAEGDIEYVYSVHVHTCTT